MLRQLGSWYEAGRSATLLKVKRFHDAEAVVVRHEPGSGCHRGRLGALQVKLADGTEFRVGTGLEPIREPSGTVPILRSPRSKMGLSPSPRRFSDRLLSDQERESPPPIGSTITFRFQELTNRGAPRFPSFVRVRSNAVATGSEQRPMQPMRVDQYQKGMLS